MIINNKKNNNKISLQSTFMGLYTFRPKTNYSLFKLYVLSGCVFPGI